MVTTKGQHILYSTMSDSEFEEPDVHAEPVPEWDTATETWAWTWELHTYGIGVAFFLLGFYTVYTSLMLFKYSKGKQKPLFVAINMLVFVLCFLRTVYLIVDPYRSREIFSELLSQILFNVAFPCLTSGFSLVNWAFLESTKFKLLSPKLQNTRILVAIIVTHFVFVLTADVLVAYVADAWFLVLVCQGSFILWALILCIGFSYSAWKVYHIKRKVRSTMYRMNDSSNGISGKFKFRKSKDRQKSSKERRDPHNLAPGVTTSLDPKPRKLSLIKTCTNGNIADKYDCLKEEPHNVPVSHDQQQPMKCDHEKSIVETNEVHTNAASQRNGGLGDITPKGEIETDSTDDVIVNTVFDPNTIDDASGTHYTANARYDSRNAQENEAFGFGDEPITNQDCTKDTSPRMDSPVSCQSKDSCYDLITCDQPNSLEMDLVPSEISPETVSNVKSSEPVFLISVEESRFHRRQQYEVKSVKRLTINKKTSVTKKMMRITLVTTSFAAIICLINTYAMFGVFSVLSDDKEPMPWGWLAFQTVMRLCELGMGATMAYFTTTTRPQKTNFQQQRRETK